MITPQEISGKIFVKAVFGGYDMTGVDDFLESVSADYSALYKENAILKSKIKVLVEKVEEYRSTEDAMRMALLTAQRMGEDIMTEASKKSTETLARTDEEIRFKLREMNDRLEDEEARLKAAQEETSKFVDAAQELIRRHANFLARLEKIRRSPDSESEPEPEPEPSAEEKIVYAAKQMGPSVTRLSPEPEEDASQSPQPSVQKQYDDDKEPVKPYVMKSEQNRKRPDDDDESVTPRPKFDFDNLKFGVNFSNDD